MMEYSNKKYQSVETLLDFVEGKIDKDQAEGIEAYLRAHPIDLAAIEGIKLLYENEGMDREQLLDLLSTMETETLASITAAGREAKVFAINKPFVLGLAMMFFLMLPFIGGDVEIAANAFNAEDIGPFELAMGTKTSP